MTELNNKIDFEVLMEVNHANPNGDPLNGNRPREDFYGNGEISDVCIKRKLRNRLQSMGQQIFVQSQERCDDGAKSLKERLEKNFENLSELYKNTVEFKKEVCEEYYDVRTFGNVFAYEKGKSIGITGPVTIQISSSVAPVDIVEMQITKSTSGTGNGRDTMGTKCFVTHGLYVIKGSISPYVAKYTGFTAEDAGILHEALKTMLEGDASAARPEGSMVVRKVVWMKHTDKGPACSSSKAFKSVRVAVKDGVTEPRSYDDYDINVDEIDGVETEVSDFE